jgi:DNA repair protein RecO (recombination protein O)
MPCCAISVLAPAKGDNVPLYQSDAFVLHTYTLGEADQIVVLFTRDFGKVRAVARRSHAPRRHTASYYQPLRLLRTIFFGRPTQALYRLNTVDLVQAFRPVHEDFSLLRYGLYMTELIDVTTHEREPMPELFALFQETLEQLMHAPHAPLLLRLFELRLLMAIGYTPQLLHCACCTRELQAHERTFSPHYGGLICTACRAEVRHAFSVSAAALEALRQALASDTPHFPAALDRTGQQDLERVLHAHLTACLGRELKSYAFLQL